MDTSELEKHFFRVYEDEADALFRFVSFRMADREKVLDIVQESYFRLWKVMVEKKPDNIRAYLYRIARNLLIDEYRAKKDVTSLETLVEAGFDIKKEEGINSHDKLDLQNALQSLRALPEKYREALWLRMVEGWAVQDIASSLDETESNISVRIYRGMKLLRKALDDRQNI
ncbi:MAG: sigma-70 family RNA polymerase sigma factor [Candidatus Moranbacteria bacterium]|nr:sigma-70 family RNA polymerase sigma factor [Candidatus Moranbacteria bacterium]